MSTEESMVPVLDLLRPAECWDLLATSRLGRIAYVVMGQPHVIPVNYAIDGESVLVRTAPGALLESADRHLVALEVDDIDMEAHTGWSVQVHGFAVAIGDAVDPTSERLKRLDLPTWAPGGDGRTSWIHVRAESVEGRRLRTVPEAL